MKKLVLILIILGAGIAVGAYFLVPSSPPSEQGYSFAAVERGDLTEIVSTTGILQPRDVVAVGSELSGKVVEIFPGADFNQTVKEHQPLLKLDTRMPELTLTQARQDLEKAKVLVAASRTKRDAAKLGWDRKKELVEKNVGSSIEADQARLLLEGAEDEVKAAVTTVQEAETAVAKANLGVELSTVKSPAAGVILERKVVLGQLVAPPVSAQLFTIATDVGKMRLHAQVVEGDIGKIAPRMKARFTVYAYTDSNPPFEGTVEQIRLMPNNVQGAVFYDTIIDVDNRADPAVKNGHEWMLRPGMTAMVDIIRRMHKDVWKMPSSALSFQLDEQLQSEAAKNKLKQWVARSDHDAWQVVWIMDRTKKPWPIFVRLGGSSASGEAEGISEGQFREVLEWDPDLQPAPDPHLPETYPKVIIAAPPGHKSGIFDQVKLKIS